MDFPDDRDFDCSFDRDDKDHDDTYAFNRGGKDHEGEYTSEVLEKKVDGLGWKVTFMAVIIPCLIGVVVVLAYFSITRKMADLQNTGSATVQEFSQIYDGKLTDIRKNLLAQEELLKAVEKKLAGIGQNAAAIKNNQSGLKDTQNSIKDNQNSIKENQNSIKSLVTADSKLSAAVESVRKDLEKLTERIGETSRQILALRQQLESVEIRLGTLKADKTDIETVRRMLADAEKKLQAAIDASASAAKSELKSMEGRLSRIERQQAGSPQGAPPAAGSSPASPVPPRISEENL